MRIRMAGVLAMVAATALTGCTTMHTCVSWVDYETPQAAYDDAQLVVRGSVTEIVGTRNLFGVDAPVHRVAVDEVLGGDEPGPTVDVASTPLTCMGDAGEYPDGDPLDVEGDVILFLTDSEGGWRLMTPYDGVLAAPDDGTLPFEIEDR